MEIGGPMAHRAWIDAWRRTMQKEWNLRPLAVALAIRGDIDPDQALHLDRILLRVSESHVPLATMQEEEVFQWYRASSIYPPAEGGAVQFFAVGDQAGVTQRLEKLKGQVIAEQRRVILDSYAVTPMSGHPGQFWLDYRTADDEAARPVPKTLAATFRLKHVLAEETLYPKKRTLKLCCRPKPG